LACTAQYSHGGYSIKAVSDGLAALRAEWAAALRRTSRLRRISRREATDWPRCARNGPSRATDWPSLRDGLASPCEARLVRPKVGQSEQSSASNGRLLRLYRQIAKIGAHIKPV